MRERLAAVVMVYATRRLLWLWAFAYVVILASGFLFPWPPNAYLESTPWIFPNETNFFGRDDVPPSTVCPRCRFANRSDLIVGLEPRGILEPECIAAIRRLPGVKRLFVGGYRDVFIGGYRDDPKQFRELCEALPNIEVWHIELSAGRIAAALFLMFALLALGGAIVQQIEATFASARARLWPRYAVPHLLLPLAIVAAAIIAQARIVRGFGANFWAALSVQVFACGGWMVFGVFNVWVSRRWPWAAGLGAGAADNGGQTKSDLSVIGINGMPILLSIVGTYLVFGLHPYLLESFFRGEMPGLSLGLFLAGLALLGIVASQAPQLGISFAETAPGRPSPAAARPRRRLAIPEFGVFRSRLDRLAAGPTPPSFLGRVRAIRSANLTARGSVLGPLLGLVLLPISAWFGLRGGSFSTIVVLLAGCAALSILVGDFQIWWRRRRILSAEFLFPWTRRQMTLSAFAAYAVDVGILTGWLLAAVIGCDLCLGWHIPLPMFFAFTVTAAAIAAVVTAGALCLLSLRHWLLAGLLGSAGAMLLLVCSFVSLNLALSKSTLLTSGLVAIEYGCLAVVLGLVAYRRWMRAEWGLVGPP